jgi:VIT1/CCC1 family predicted Fe2+/Mn2+ transporter
MSGVFLKTEAKTPPPHEKWHDMEGKSVREVIFGLNDGLVTAFGFVSGVSGAHLKPLLIFLTGLAQAVAGGLSMFFGAYLSTKAQRQFFEAEIEREKWEIENMPEKEIEEVREIYRAKGFTPEETEMIVKRIVSNKEEWLSFMMKEELGLFPENFDNPLKVSWIIGLSFFLAALVPVFPYIFFSQEKEAFIFSAISTLVVLFIAGAWKTKVTRTSWISSGIEMLVVGLIAGGIGFGVGKLLALLGLSGVGG